MKKIKVASRYRGLIPVRSKYTDGCIIKKENLTVSVLNERKDYLLTWEQLKAPVKSLRVKDKFSPDIQQLHYYAPDKIKADFTNSLDL